MDIIIGDKGILVNGKGIESFKINGEYIVTINDNTISFIKDKKNFSIIEFNCKCKVNIKSYINIIFNCEFDSDNLDVNAPIVFHNKNFKLNNYFIKTKGLCINKYANVQKLNIVSDRFNNNGTIKSSNLKFKGIEFINKGNLILNKCDINCLYFKGINKFYCEQTYIFTNTFDYKGYLCGNNGLINIRKEKDVLFTKFIFKNLSINVYNKINIKLTKDSQINDLTINAKEVDITGKLHTESFFGNINKLNIIGNFRCSYFYPRNIKNIILCESSYLYVDSIHRHTHKYIDSIVNEGSIYIKNSNSWLKASTFINNGTIYGNNITVHTDAFSGKGKFIDNMTKTKFIPILHIYCKKLDVSPTNLCSTTYTCITTNNGNYEVNTFGNLWINKNFSNEEEYYFTGKIKAKNVIFYNSKIDDKCSIESESIILNTKAYFNINKMNNIKCNDVLIKCKTTDDIILTDDIKKVGYGIHSKGKIILGTKDKFIDINVSLLDIKGELIDAKYGKINIDEKGIFEAEKDIIFGTNKIVVKNKYDGWYGHASRNYNYYTFNGSYLVTNGNIEIKCKDLLIDCCETLIQKDLKVICEKLVHKASKSKIFGNFHITCDSFNNIIYNPVRVTLPNTYYTYTNRYWDMETSDASILKVYGDMIYYKNMDWNTLSSIDNVIGTIKPNPMDVKKGELKINYNIKTKTMVRGSYFHKGSWDSASYSTAIGGQHIIGDDYNMSAHNFANTGTIICKGDLKINISGSGINMAVSWANKSDTITMKPLHSILDKSVLFKKEILNNIPKYVPIVPINSIFKTGLNKRLIITDKCLTETPESILDPIALEYAISSINSEFSKQDLNKCIGTWQMNALEFAKESKLMLEDKDNTSIVKYTGNILSLFQKKVTKPMMFWKTHSENGKTYLVPYIVQKTSGNISGIIGGKKSLEINTESDFTDIGGKKISLGDIDINVKGKYTSKSKISFKQRREIIDGKDFHVKEHIVDSRNATFGKNIRIRATTAEISGSIIKGNDISIKTKDGLISDVDKETYIATNKEGSGKKVTMTKISGTNIVSNEFIGKNVELDGGKGGLLLKATKIIANKANITAEKGIILMDERKEKSIESFTKKKSTFGVSKRINSGSYENTSVKCDFNINTLTMKAPKILMIGPKIESKKIKLDTDKGDVIILPTKNIKADYRTETKDNGWIVVNRNGKAEHEVYEKPEITGEIATDAKRICIGTIHNERPLLTINMDEDTMVLYKNYENKHIFEHKKITNAGKATLAAVAAITAITTYGTCTSAVAGLGLEGTTALMAAGAMSAGVTTVAVSTVAHKGNIGNAIEDLFSESGLQSMCIGALTAGLKIADTSTYTGIAKESLVRATISTGVKGIFTGKINLENYVLNVVINTLGNCAVSKIGDMRYDGTVDTITHKVLHGIVGGLKGACLGEDAIAGAIGGAIGSVVAEVAMDVMNESYFQIKAKNPTMKDEDIFEQINKNIDTSKKIAKILAVSTVFATRQDVDMGLNCATDAIEHNSVRHIMKKALSGVFDGIINEYKEAYENNGINGVTDKIAIDALLSALGIKMLTLLKHIKCAGFLLKINNKVIKYVKTKLGWKQVPIDKPVKGKIITVNYNSKLDINSFNKKLKALNESAKKGNLKKTKVYTKNSSEHKQALKDIEKRFGVGTDKTKEVQRRLTVRDPYKTRKVRKNLDKQIEKTFGKDSEKTKRLIKRNKNRHVDHINELQTGGTDTVSNMTWLDGKVNTHFGREIFKEMKNVKLGEKIGKIVTK